MRVKIEALQGVFRNLIAVLDNAIFADEAMADAAAEVAQDYIDVDQHKIGAFLTSISRQHRIKAIENRGKRAALELEYDFLL